jgi:hypothetical protein
LGNPKRPFFNWGSNYANEHRDEFDVYDNFRTHWVLDENDFQMFIDYLSSEKIEINAEELEKDKDYILNMLKSEVASAHWGKDEAMGIRLNYDNQVIDALNYFDEATGFINKSQ